MPLSCKSLSWKNLIFIIFGSVILVCFVLPSIRRSSAISIQNNDDLQSQITAKKELIVIPGGGGSGALPPWTLARLDAAIDYYSTKRIDDNMQFLVLSAGSLNSPSGLQEERLGNTGRIRFECSYMIDYLSEQGIDKSIIHGDFMSWDTLGNAMVLRMFLEGLLEGGKDDNPSSKQATVIHLSVFISDFHANRVAAAFRWAISLSPSMVPRVEMSIIRVPSDKDWFGDDPAAYQSRIAHEERATHQIRQHQQSITTWPQFLRFMLMGEHRGLRNYINEVYKRSNGSGW